MLSWLGFFQISSFLVSPGVCSLWDFLRVFAILFSCYLSIQPLCYVLSVSISFSNFFFHFQSLFDLSFCFLHRLIDIIFFRYIWRSNFNYIALTLSCYLLSLSSFVNIFWFISSSSIGSLVCCCLFRSFKSIGPLCIFPSLVFSLVSVVSLFVLLASFPNQVLYFSSSSLGECQFYHWLILLLHGLVGLVRWCALEYLKKII